MTSPRTFRVYVHEWTCWRTDVEANSPAAAEAIAQCRWDAEGPDAFQLHDSGTDGIEAEAR